MAVCLVNIVGVVNYCYRVGSLLLAVVAQLFVHTLVADSHPLCNKGSTAEGMGTTAPVFSLIPHAGSELLTAQIQPADPFFNVLIRI